jgi:transcriptional regulator with GAF, ATPase, and Fis domain
MSTPEVTVIRPDGSQHRTALTDIAAEIERGHTSCTYLGRQLVVRLESADSATSTRTADRGDDANDSEEETAEGQVRAGWTAARKATRDTAAKSQKSPSGRKRYNIDKDKLRAAMDKPDFSVAEYARGLGMPAALLYYHVRAAQKTPKARRK